MGGGAAHLEILVLLLGKGCLDLRYRWLVETSLTASISCSDIAATIWPARNRLLTFESGSTNWVQSLRTRRRGRGKGCTACLSACESLPNNLPYALTVAYSAVSSADLACRTHMISCRDMRQTLMLNALYHVGSKFRLDAHCSLLLSPSC